MRDCILCLVHIWQKNEYLFIYLSMYLATVKRKPDIISISETRIKETLLIPTRVSKTSATIIDHILTNGNTRQLYPGVIKTDLSDHYITFVNLVQIDRNR